MLKLCACVYLYIMWVCIPTVPPPYPPKRSNVHMGSENICLDWTFRCFAWRVNVFYPVTQNEIQPCCYNNSSQNHRKYFLTACKNYTSKLLTCHTQIINIDTFIFLILDVQRQSRPITIQCSKNKVYYWKICNYRSTSNYICYRWLVPCETIASQNQPKLADRPRLKIE